MKLPLGIANDAGATTNQYVVDIIASDGGNESTQTVTINVTDIDEPFAATSATNLDVPENIVASDFSPAYWAHDPEEPDLDVTYRLAAASLNNDNDNDLFGYSESGAFYFLTAPDFENGQSQVGDDLNSHVLDIVASASLTNSWNNASPLM